MVFWTSDEIQEQLKKELSEVEGENIAIEHEVEEIQRRCVEGGIFICHGWEFSYNLLFLFYILFNYFT